MARFDGPYYTYEAQRKFEGYEWEIKLLKDQIQTQRDALSALMSHLGVYAAHNGVGLTIMNKASEKK